MIIDDLLMSRAWKVVCFSGVSFENILIYETAIAEIAAIIAINTRTSLWLLFGIM